MTNIEKYREFCKIEDDMPLFSRDWWLDCVCDEGEWDVVLVEKNGEIMASMPYYIKKKLIFKAITLPKLTQVMGPYIKYPKNQKYSASLSWDKKIMSELIEQLPKVDSFTQSFNYNTNNILPFYWKGYSMSMGYTYTIEDLTNMDKVFANLSKAKTQIKKAQKNDIKVVDSDDIEAFYDINKITYQNQGVEIPYSLSFIKNLYQKAKEQSSVIMKFAIKDDTIYSARLCFYDAKYLYLVVGSSNRNIKLYGSEYLVDWEMIQFASKKGLSFNFNGSMMERVEQRVRYFGTVQKTYPIITKTDSKLLRIAQSI